MKRTSGRLRTTIAVSALALALSPILGLSAGASGTGNNTWTPVGEGFSPASVPGATPFGPVAPNTPEQVSFILDENNKQQLESSVERGINSYLSVSQFAQQYGQSQSNINELQKYLSGFGITTTVYPDNVDVSASGTAGEFDKALSTTQNQYHVPGYPGHNGMQNVPAQTIHGNATSPELPYQLAQFVLAVLGLTNYSAFTSQSVHVNTSLSKPSGSGSGSTAACLTLSGLPDACNTPANFESNYGLTPIESADAGQGQTIGIVTLAALDVGAPEYFWSNVLHIAHPGTVTTQNIDGGAPGPNFTVGSSETDLDTEQSGAIAPGANVIVYEAPNTDIGFADAFFTAASQNVAGSVSSSWGESETVIQAAVNSGDETPAYIASFDEAFLELAAQGQATFVSAGDSAAYDASGDLGTTNLSVDSPGDSPYVTSSGGTTLPWTGSLSGPDGSATVTVSQQRAWGWDYLWQPIATITGDSLASVAEGTVVGGGGGLSVVEQTPLYQQNVSGTHSYQDVQYLTPTGYQNVDGVFEPTAWNFNATPSVQRGGGSGRAEPDLSADADPYSGYLEYSPSYATESPAQPVLEGGWGGTSFVAPQLNGSTAVIDAVVGHRVGFWNPSIYSFASSGNSPFTTLNQPGTSNDNIYFTGNPGTVYNPATGLGIPNLAELARDFR